MEHEHDGQIDRQPGRVEEGKQAVAGKELAQPGQIVQRLGRSVHPATEQRLLEAGVVQALAEKGVQARTDPHHDA
ncbi:hypothetical protein D3C84_1114950 [compost metagenome]